MDSSDDYITAVECGSSSNEAAAISRPGLAPELIHSMQMHALLEYVFNIRWCGARATPRAENVADCYAANNWSRRCDSAREGKRSTLDEDALRRWADTPKDWPLNIERWLTDGQVAVHVPSKQAAEGEDRLTSEPAVVWLHPAHLDNLIKLLVGDLLRSNHRQTLFERMAQVTYLMHKGLDKHLATARLRDTLKGDLDELLESITTYCVNYSIFAYLCPEILGGNHRGLTAGEVLENLKNLTNSGPGLMVFADFVEGLINVDQTTFLDQLWLEVFKSLESIRITSYQPKTMALIKHLLTVPAMRERIVVQPFWLAKSCTGYSFMRETFLGRLHQVSAVDWSWPGSADDVGSLLGELMGHIVAQGALPSATGCLNRGEQTQAAHIQQIVQILKTLLKHGGEVRNAVLAWFAAALELNVEQGKISFRNYQSQVPRMGRVTENLTTILMRVSTPSVSFNVAWVLLELCRPIKLEKINDIDPFYGEFCRHGDDGALLGHSWLDEARMRSDRELEEEWRSDMVKEVKFMTQVFWLTLKAQRTFLYQCFNDALQRQYHLVQIVTRSDNTSAHDKERLFGEVILWHTLLRQEEFSSAYLHFVDLVNAFICRAVFRNSAATTLHPHPLCQALRIPASLQLPETVALEFKALPAVYISDTYEAFSKYVAICVSPALNNHNTSTIETAFAPTNCEMFALVLLLILGGPENLINSPPMRLDIGGRCLGALAACDKLRQRVCQTTVAERMLAPSICNGFIHAQKLSYYLRIEMRLILTRELEHLLRSQSFRNSMDLFAAEHKSDFERFLLFLASNTSYVLEEALTFLTEIKARENKPQAEQSLPNAAPTASTGGGETANANDEFSREADRVAQEIEGTRNVEEMDFNQLTSQCQNFMEAGSGSLNVFSRLDDRCFRFIRDNKILIEPTVSCLDSCLASLVGPKCMALKVSNFEKYKFRPREFLADLVRIYVKLIGAKDDDHAAVLKAIREDGRYYSKALFDKAVRIVRREGLASAGDFTKFAELVEQLNADDVEGDWIDELIMSGDVPDEFVDPLMSIIMTDPVMLPTSGVIVERNVIERHLLSDQFDPFNRMPLDRAMLVPQDDLKQRIHEFLRQAREKHP